MPTLGKLKFGVSICTCADLCAMACFGDVSAVEDPNQFVEIFVKKFNEALKDEKVWQIENSLSPTRKDIEMQN